jgi:hypothetical protein
MSFLPRKAFTYSTVSEKYGNYLYFFAREYDKEGSGKIEYGGFREFCYGLGFGRKGFQTMWNLGRTSSWFRGSSKSALYMVTGHGEDYRSVEVFGKNLEMVTDKPTVHKFATLCTLVTAAAPVIAAKGKLSRSRSLRTVGKRTGTEYKQTVHNRIKKAEARGWAFDHTARTESGARITSEYGIGDVTYRKDFRTTVSKPSFQKASGAPCLRVRKYGSYVQSCSSKVGKFLGDALGAFVDFRCADAFSFAS